MFRLVKLSTELVLALALASFVILWVVLQEFGTVLIWLLILGCLVKIAKYISHTKVVRITHLPPTDYKTATRYPRPGVSKPVVIDRANQLSKPLDKSDKWV